MRPRTDQEFRDLSSGRPVLHVVHDIFPGQGASPGIVPESPYLAAICALIAALSK